MTTPPTTPLPENASAEDNAPVEHADQSHLYDTGPVDAHKELFDTSVTFADLGLPDDVLEGLTASGFVHPTFIQAQLIPHVLAGKDVIGQAKTGTGKTAAFGLPMLAMADPNIRTQGLVLAPTRELANQIAKELDDLGRATGIRTTTIIGGESQRDQTDSLKQGGHLVVGTPGRVMDLHSQGKLKFNDLRFVALDEVDRMLDIGFRDDIRRILKAVNNQSHSETVQTIFVSATVDQDIERLARTFMREDAEKIRTVSGSLTVAAVDQKYIAVERWDKRALLLKLLVTRKPEATVVFCKTKMSCKKIAKYLKEKGLNAREIHGDLHQSRRNKVMEALRKEQVDVLVATDLAARGLDVDHITHVINHDLPEDPEVYIHRIGRTARAGRAGTAWSFATPEEGQYLMSIEQLAGAEIDELKVPDFKPGPVPKRVQEERDGAEQKRIEPAKHSERALGGIGDASGYSRQELEAMFPDGKIPKTLPKRGLAGRFKRRGR